MSVKQVAQRMQVIVQLSFVIQFVQSIVGPGAAETRSAVEKADIIKNEDVSAAMPKFAVVYSQDGVQYIGNIQKVVFCDSYCKVIFTDSLTIYTGYENVTLYDRVPPFMDAQLDDEEQFVESLRGQTQ